MAIILFFNFIFNVSKIIYIIMYINIMSLKLIIKDEVGIITIDREKSLNALNKQVLKEILKTLKVLEIEWI